MKKIIAALIWVCLSQGCFANPSQSSWQVSVPPNGSVMGVVPMSINGSNLPQAISGSNPLPVSPSINPSTFISGQVIIATTGTQVCLPSATLVNGVIVKSLLGNSSSKQTIGPTGVTNIVNGSGNGYVLVPGEAASVGITNASAVCVNGTTGDIFTYIGN